MAPKQDKQTESDKGNGEPKPSTVTVVFPGPGAADPLNVQMEGATPGQLAVAAVWLFAMALHNVFTAMSAQQQQAMREQQMMEAIMRGGK